MENNIQQLLESAETLVKELMQAYQTESSSEQALFKSQTPPVLKKEEKKEEEEEEKEVSPKLDTHYETQAPEASDEAKEHAHEDKEEAPAEEAPAEALPEDMPAEAEEDPAQILAELDDEALQSLLEQIKAELMRRSAAPEEKKEEEPKKEELAMAKSLNESYEKLAKAESALAEKDKQIEELKKSVGELLDIVQKVIERPVIRAATPHVSYFKKESLTKAEDEDHLRKSLDLLFNDKQKMSSLKKHEYDALIQYYSGMPISESTKEVLKGLVK